MPFPAEFLAASEAPHVAYRAVSKAYGGVQAVDDLTLEIQRGEFLTLLGPSGSGKTTALMLLAGFEQPDAGQIFLGGRRIDRLAANRRNIGVVFQNYALFPHMSVGENLAYPLKVRRVPRAERTEKVRQALDLVQLSGLESRRPEQLSGGQQQRVAVARALIFQPDLVLMDEPLGALDKQLREQMQAEIKAIHARLGVTFLYVTHDQAEALTLSDRIAVFAQGRVQQIGAPRSLYEWPETGFVASFIGESSRLDGQIEAVEGDIATLRLASGAQIRALATAGLAPGRPGWLSLRPERIALLGPDESAEVSVTAELFSSLYAGDHLRVTALVGAGAAGQPLVFKLPIGSDAEALVTGLARGAALRLGWPMAAGRAFAGSL